MLLAKSMVRSLGFLSEAQVKGREYVGAWNAQAGAIPDEQAHFTT